MTAVTTQRFCTILVCGATASLFLVACSRTPDPGPDEPTTPKVKIVEPKSVSRPAVPDTAPTPFFDAVRLDPPDGENRPPDVTVNGKTTGKLFEQISGKGGLWEQVSFVKGGQPVKHFALVKTDAGDFKIELLHDAAPNHVRSFICLARAGYFDGLPFHASIRRENKEALQGYLESGCPKGTGEIGYGSIGYWLKPEINSNLKHEEGTVGAWHPQNLERAAARFYIILNRNPAFDGEYTIFGKVVHGLDVAHTINKRPIQDEEHKGPALEPYRIRQVQIQQVREDGSLVAYQQR